MGLKRKEKRGSSRCTDKIKRQVREPRAMRLGRWSEGRCVSGRQVGKWGMIKKSPKERLKRQHRTMFSLV